MEAIAGAVPLDALAPQRLAEPVHVHLQRGNGRFRRLGSPQGVDEAVPRHDRVRVQQQEGQQGALLRGSKRQRAVVPDDLDRAQDAEFHARRPLSQPGPKRILSGPIDGVPDPRNERKEPQMIRAGDTIENPVTGERIVFRQTSRETNGQAVVIETFVQPNGFVAAAHVHPSQEERFEVLRGSVGFRIGRKKLVAGPGQRAHRPRRHAAQVLERGRGGGPLRLRGAPSAPVRGAARDDVRPRRRRQDEPEGHAEPAAARGDRERALRHGSPAVPAGHRAADRPRPRQPARAALGYEPVYVPAEPAATAVAASI